jgi:hypothetical protein
VFSPAITDGSIGDMLHFHSIKNPGLVLDIIQGKPGHPTVAGLYAMTQPHTHTTCWMLPSDVHAINSIAEFSKHTGAAHLTHITT